MKFRKTTSMGAKSFVFVVSILVEDDRYHMKATVNGDIFHMEDGLTANLPDTVNAMFDDGYRMEEWQ